MLAAAVLERIAVVPADRFAAGPPAGRYVDRGGSAERLEQPRFAAQPVQGVSAIQPGPQRDTWWALSDNGFGSKWNSLDYRACLYLFEFRTSATPGALNPVLRRRLELRDPHRRFPYPLVLHDSDPRRPFTGGDIDPESLVVMPDGSFWIGEEHGPWLLHFSAGGRLLAPPIELELPDVGAVRAAVHPRVLTGRARANLRASKGVEGLAAQRRAGQLLLYALLEGVLDGEADPRDLRLLEFDPRRRAWTGRHWRYRLADPTHAIGELASYRGAEFLVIERDDRHGAAAQFKKIFTVALTPDGRGERLPARELVDLLEIADPARLASATGRLRFSILDDRGRVRAFRRAACGRQRQQLPRERRARNGRRQERRARRSDRMAVAAAQIGALSTS